MTRTVLLGDVVDLNPTVSLKKGTVVKFISMDKLEPYTRKIKTYEKREYKSGSKFKNGDTLLARITPCLENGKTAFVDSLDIDEIGAGSTEFVVMRAKDGITVSEFVYYLSVSPDFRKYAIQSMVGTSGRQRIQNDSLAKFEFKLPDINAQKKIADILGTIDEKIELNRKMNETLEQIGQSLFKKYFITNPETVQVPIENIIDFVRGIEPGSKNYSEFQTETSIPFLRVGDLSQRASNLYINKELSKGKVVSNDDVLVSFDGAPGLVSAGLAGAYSTGLRKLVRKSETISTGYMYFLMKSEAIQDIIERYSEGTTIKHASRSIKYMKAPILEVEPKELNTLLGMIINNIQGIQTLTTLRDSLLPRLISGKIKL